ncbi:MAG: SRPBCC domain-containing protein, partial [Planctomycetes bacterium]|nr:SRPBCC domain-containing protein [Planctomycetota bacterium]
PLTVYEAWTSEQAFAAWSWGDLASDVTATLDVRPGGAYEVATARPDGTTWAFKGTYEEIDPGRRLVYSLSWTAPMGYDTPGERVTVDFHADGDGTRMVMRHDGVPGAKARATHEHGWQNTFDHLERRLRG